MKYSYWKIQIDEKQWEFPPNWEQIYIYAWIQPPVLPPTGSSQQKKGMCFHPFLSEP